MTYRSFWTWAAVAALTACYGGTKDHSVPHELLSSEWSEDAPGSAIDPSVADPNVGEDGEVCDGWDNDVDGEVDEGTGGGPCTPDWDATSPVEDRIFRCLDGELVCTECEPGSERTADCGCNVERIDACDAGGRWILGVCDGCELPPVVCECTPGELKIERCDVCLEEGCGTTCVGSTWECTEDCVWEQIDGCQILLAQCDRDQILEEDCGNCGTRLATCDGCFWQLGECQEQGECTPGDEKKIPCLDGSGACVDGYVATLECDQYCEWEQNRSCRGCALGSTQLEIESCEPDPSIAGDLECGNQTVAYTCEVGITHSICDDTIPLIQGELSEHGLALDECTPAECADVGTGGGGGHGNPGDDGDGEPSGGGEVCIPGTTDVVNCVTSSGLCGTAEVVCEEEAWSAPDNCIEDPDACVPGTEELEQVSCGTDACGMTYTLVRTCTVRDGVCSWSSDRSDRRDSCPDCEAGETQEINCTTPQGQCGTRTAFCDSNCQWDDGVCEPLPDACPPGAERTTNFSCGENTCGREYQVTERCNGCTWDVISSNKNQVCPDCQTGESEATSQLCRPGFPECGYVPMICNEQCNWVEGNCPPCG